MANLTLEAVYRSDTSKSHIKKLRRDGYVTASVFGHDAEPVSLEIKLEDLAGLVKHSKLG